MSNNPFNPFFGYSRGYNPDMDQVALFIDWDNLTISNYQDRNVNRPDLEVIVRKAQQYGTLVIARAYAEWQVLVDRLEVYKAGVEPIYAPVFHSDRDLTGQLGRGKSLADPVMVTDCIDFLHLLPQVGTYVLVTGDKDMMPVVRLAKMRGRRVVVIGPDYIANVLQQVSDEFIPYRILLAQGAYDQYGYGYNVYSPSQIGANQLPVQGSYPGAPASTQSPSNDRDRRNRRLSGRRSSSSSQSSSSYASTPMPSYTQPQAPSNYGYYSSQQSYPAYGSQQLPPQSSGQPSQTTNAYLYDQYGQQYSQPQYGQSQYNQTQPQYGQGSQYGQTQQPQQYGQQQTQYGQPQYGQQQAQPSQPAASAYQQQPSTTQGTYTGRDYYGNPYPSQTTPQAQSYTQPQSYVQPSSTSYGATSTYPSSSASIPTKTSGGAAPTTPAAATPVAPEQPQPQPRGRAANDFEEIKELVRNILTQKTASGRAQLRARDLKEEILRRLPNFSERRYGFSKFKALLSAIEAAGIIQTEQADHIVWVSLPGSPKLPDEVLAQMAQPGYAATPVEAEEAEENEENEEQTATLEITEIEIYQVAASEPEESLEVIEDVPTEEVAPQQVQQYAEPALPSRYAEERKTTLVEAPIGAHREQRTPVTTTAKAETQPESAATVATGTNQTGPTFEQLGPKPALLEQPYFQDVIVLIENLRHRHRWLGYELLLSNIRDYLSKQQMSESEAKIQAGSILSRLLSEGVLKPAIEVHARGARKMRVPVEHLQDDHKAVRYALAAARLVEQQAQAAKAQPVVEQAAPETTQAKGTNIHTLTVPRPNQATAQTSPEDEWRPGEVQQQVPLSYAQESALDSEVTRLAPETVQQPIEQPTEQLVEQAIQPEAVQAEASQTVVDAPTENAQPESQPEPLTDMETHDSIPGIDFTPHAESVEQVEQELAQRAAEVQAEHGEAVEPLPQIMEAVPQPETLAPQSEVLQSLQATAEGEEDNEPEEDGEPEEVAVVGEEGHATRRPRRRRTTKGATAVAEQPEAVPETHNGDHNPGEGENHQG